MSEQHSDPALTALEASLATLTPRPGNIDSDLVLFQAGRYSTRPPSRFWPRATAFLILVAGVQGWLLWHRPVPGPGVGEHPVPFAGPAMPLPPERERPESRPPSAPPPSERDGPIFAIKEEAPDSRARLDRLRLRQDVLRWGVEALPALRPPDAVVKKTTPFQSTPHLPRYQGNLLGNAWLSFFLLQIVP
jgi:hypothetical protein